MKEKNQKEILSRILKELKPYSGWIVLSLICAIITVSQTLLIPILIGRAVDCIAARGKVDYSGLIMNVLYMGISIGVTCLFQWLMNRVNNRITYSVTKALRDKAFDKMQKMPLSNIDGHGHGDYMSRIVSDADTFADGLLMGFTQAFTGVMTIVGTIFFMI